jgi:hypothetical protein
MNNTINHTGAVVSKVLRTTRYRRATILFTLIFFTLYSFATRQLTVTDQAGLSTQFANNAWETMLEQTSFLQFEPVLRLNGVYLSYFLNPFDLLIAITLAVLTGVNLALSYAAIKQPQACSVSQTRGFLASLPALLAGSACCAPTILLVLGVQASTALLTVFSFLLPTAFILLCGSLIWASSNVHPERLA